jgi:hypothetical protein
VTSRRILWRGRKPVLFASVGAALAVLAGAAVPAAFGAASSASADKVADGTTPVTLGAAPLGVDMGPWDTLYSNSAKLSAMQSYLKAIGIGQIHYGGGATADSYDWQTNKVLTNGDTCPVTPSLATFSTSCSASEPFDFASESADARALGAQTFATVNYGSGTPALAAAWVKQSLTAGQGVTQWSIGNESYGCWENDYWVTQAPADDPGYEADIYQTCPLNQAPTLEEGMTTMADSYAVNAGDYMAAMAAVDPSIQIGVPWAFDGTVGGAAVGDNDIWNDTILSEDEQYITFVEAHWYAFSFGGDMGVGGNPTAQQVIQSVEQIPSEYAKIRATLNTYDPTATVEVGETGVSYLATNATCTPTGALFAAGDALEWLAAGATTEDWWPLETGANKGSACDAPDEAMFTGNGTPDTIYSGYQLASQLAKPRAALSALTTSNPTAVLGFQSVLPNGQVVVALINTYTSSAEKITVGTSLAGNLSTQTYSAGNQNATNSKIVDGTTTAGAIADGISLPAQSIVVLKTELPSKITVGAASTVKAGTKVKISGKLTLGGAPAPKGTTVKIYRRVAGKSVNSATLTTTTSAGGSYSTTNIPSASGSYDYVASYPGSSVYKSSSSTVLVHVTKAKPSLKLTFSAGSVNPGRKVTVTASLGAWHTNKTLVIYAQPKGSTKKLVKRATINSKGRLVVSYTVKANTTFTVTFSGDGWYTSASVSATVKA